MGNFSESIIFMVIVAAFLIVIITMIVSYLLRSPFKYPYFKWCFDISGKRKVKIENEIDIFLIRDGMDCIEDHYETIKQWKENCQKKIEKAWLKKYRSRQYEQCLDDEHAFIFFLIRKVTKYKQENYVRTPYKADVVEAKYFFDYGYLLYRYKKLEDIDFQCTLKEYNQKKQRNLSTQKLRDEIKLRDNYTCQMCGKYMPDEVGLHIDHIIPVSKGGKTIPSNLQVLCSKCNGAKSSKL